MFTSYHKLLYCNPSHIHHPFKLQNLDALHDHLGLLYPGMRAPSFRCTEESDGSLILHYYSDRAGLEYIVIGIVKVRLNCDCNPAIIMKKVNSIERVNFSEIFLKKL